MGTVTVATNESLDRYLQSLRGRVTEACFGYPDALLLDIEDDEGRKWAFTTLDSDWQPHDPELLVGRTLRRTSLNLDEGVLALQFGDALILTVTAGKFESWSDPPYWEILTPDGQTVEYGPGPSWRVKDSEAAPPEGSGAAVETPGPR